MPLAAALAIASACLATAFIVGLAMMLPFFRRREAQRTLRAAIEHGVSLDPAVVERILNPEPAQRGSGRRDLLTSGVITLCVGAGIALLGWFISVGEGDASALYSLAGVGALVGLVGVGLLLSAAIAGDGPKGARDDRGA